MYDMEKEERVLDNLEIYVKYDKTITREQAEETIDFIMELENKIDELEKENENRISESLAYDLAKARVQELEYIIEEVREYIENYCIGNLVYENKTHKRILEILDKEKNNGKI